MLAFLHANKKTIEIKQNFTFFFLLAMKLSKKATHVHREPHPVGLYCTNTTQAEASDALKNKKNLMRDCHMSLN
jgi:hypothetical protein